MNYEQPANTIIHEIVHLGVETSLVQRYQLSHPMKERLVDTIVYLLFNDLLPQYKVQNMGETRLDQYLSTPEDLVDLEASRVSPFRVGEEGSDLDVIAALLHGPGLNASLRRPRSFWLPGLGGIGTRIPRSRRMSCEEGGIVD